MVKHYMKQHVIDLSKVRCAKFGYKNQYGHFRDYKPRYTYLNMSVDKSTISNTNKSSLDTWIPIIYFTFSANHSITYTHDRAISLWAAWRSRVFAKE